MLEKIKEGFIWPKKAKKELAFPQSENGVYRLIDEDVSFPIAFTANQL